jgi:23S rRNA pseudouridine2457 synthase
MHKYLLFYKPYAVLSTFTDSSGRSTLKDYIPVPGVYAAGRLDYKSEGLLLLTDDGPFIQHLIDPHNEHPRTYFVQIEGVISNEAIDRLRNGVELSGRMTKPTVIKSIKEPELPSRPVPVRNYHPTSWVKIVLYEGKKHEIRRMTAVVGIPTLRLIRFAIGKLTIDKLQPGEWRELTKIELEQLMNGNVEF